MEHLLYFYMFGRIYSYAEIIFGPLYINIWEILARWILCWGYSERLLLVGTLLYSNI